MTLVVKWSIQGWFSRLWERCETVLLWSWCQPELDTWFVCHSKIIGPDWLGNQNLQMIIQHRVWKESWYGSYGSVWEQTTVPIFSLACDGHVRRLLSHFGTAQNVSPHVSPQPGGVSAREGLSVPCLWPSGNQTWRWRILIFRWFSHYIAALIYLSSWPRFIASGYLQIHPRALASLASLASWLRYIVDTSTSLGFIRNDCHCSWVCWAEQEGCNVWVDS